MTHEVIIAGLVILAIIPTLFGVLWIYIRFAFISEHRLRGWESRLAQPRLAEVESKWGVNLPRSLETLYRSGGVAEQSEFDLVPPGEDSPQRWYIAAFIPLTVRDVAEWIKITRVPGIPLACDGCKGIYYLPFDALREGSSPPVLLREPGWCTKDREVAASVEDFVRFQPAVASEEDEEEVA